MKLADVGARHRPVNAVDVAASALAKVMPGGLAPRIDRLRHDVNGVLAGFGARPRPYSGPEAPIERPRPLADIDPIEHMLPGRRLRRRWVTLRTDLRWLRRDLRGESRPSTVTRSKASRYRAAERSALEPRPVVVRAVRRETPDAVTLQLEEIDGRPLRFEAGQFLTFHLDVDGARLRRAYSLSSSPLDGPGATITVKQIEGGRASRWMQHVQPGARLRVLGPSGSFVAHGNALGDALVMIAGGSGITPVISIAETVLRSRPDARVRLLYGNRRLDDVIFRARLDALAATHPGLEITHALETPPESWTGLVGQLDAHVIARWLDTLGDGDARGYYVCGPTPMMDAARQALRVHAPDAEVHEERFQSPGTATRPRVLPSEPLPVRLVLAGETHQVEVAPGETILEAAIAAGLALPFSCAMGGCAACKGTLREGEVVMDEPNCLTERERAAGAVLTCCARPTSPAQVEIE